MCDYFWFLTTFETFQHIRSVCSRVLWFCLQIQEREVLELDGLEEPQEDRHQKKMSTLGAQTCAFFWENNAEFPRISCIGGYASDALMPRLLLNLAQALTEILLWDGFAFTFFNMSEILVGDWSRSNCQSQWTFILCTWGQRLLSRLVQIIVLDIWCLDFCQKGVSV